MVARLEEKGNKAEERLEEKESKVEERLGEKENKMEERPEEKESKVGERLGEKENKMEDMNNEEGSWPPRWAWRSGTRGSRDPLPGSSEKNLPVIGVVEFGGPWRRTGPTKLGKENT